MKNKRLPIVLALLAALPGTSSAAGKKKPSPQEASLQASQAVASQDLPQTLHDQHLKAIDELLKNADNFSATKEVFLERLEKIHACFEKDGFFKKDLEDNSSLLTEKMSSKLNALKKNLESKLLDFKMELLKKIIPSNIDKNEIKTELEKEGLQISNDSEQKINFSHLDGLQCSQELKDWEPKKPNETYKKAKENVEEMLKYLNLALKKIPAAKRKQLKYAEPIESTHKNPLTGTQPSDLSQQTIDPRDDNPRAKKRQKLFDTTPPNLTGMNPSNLSQQTICLINYNPSAKKWQKPFETTTNDRQTSYDTSFSTEYLQGFDAQTPFQEENPPSGVLSDETIDNMNLALDIAPTKETIDIIRDILTNFATTLDNQHEEHMILWEEQEKQEEIFKTICDKIHGIYLNLKKSEQENDAICGELIIDNKTSIFEYMDDILMTLQGKYWSCRLSPKPSHHEETRSQNKLDKLIENFQSLKQQIQNFKYESQKNQHDEITQNDEIIMLLKENLKDPVIKKLRKFFPRTQPGAKKNPVENEQTKRMQKNQASFLLELLENYVNFSKELDDENSFPFKKDLINELVFYQDHLLEDLSYETKYDVDLLPMYDYTKNSLHSSHKNPNGYSSTADFEIHNHTMPVLLTINRILELFSTKEQTNAAEIVTHKNFLKKLTDLFCKNIEILCSKPEIAHYFIKKSFISINVFFNSFMKNSFKEATENICTCQDEAQALQKTLDETMATYQQIFEIYDDNNTSSYTEWSDEEEEATRRHKTRYQEEEKTPEKTSQEGIKRPLPPVPLFRDK